MAINSVNCFCMGNIDGAEYILDSLHGRLWEVDVQTGGVRRHRKSRAQYMECGAAITLVHAAVMDHRLTQLERLLDLESLFCLHWLRELGHENAAPDRAEEMAAQVGTSIEALRDRHALIEVNGEKCKLPGLGAYNLKRNYIPK